MYFTAPTWFVLFFIVSSIPGWHHLHYAAKDNFELLILLLLLPEYIDYKCVPPFLVYVLLKIEPLCILDN